MFIGRLSELISSCSELERLFIIVSQHYMSVFSSSYVKSFLAICMHSAYLWLLQYCIKSLHYLHIYDIPDMCPHMPQLYIAYTYNYFQLMYHTLNIRKAQTIDLSSLFKYVK